MSARSSNNHDRSSLECSGHSAKGGATVLLHLYLHLDSHHVASRLISSWEMPLC